MIGRSVTPRALSPDGAWLVYNDDADIWLAPLEGSSGPRAFVATEAAEWSGQVSPDGRWLAYWARDTFGGVDVYVISFPDGDRKLQVTQGGGGYPLWSHDGTELFYYHEDAYYVVEVTSGASLSFGTPEKLFKGEYGVDDDFGRDYCVAPDGRFLMMKPLLPKEDYLRLVVVENFVLELEERLSHTGEKR